MAHHRIFLPAVTGTFLLSGIFFSGHVFADVLVAERLEVDLASLQTEWRQNARQYARAQRQLQREATLLREELCNMGQRQHCPGGIDLDRLALAVAYAETMNCSEGTGVTHNNCHGIRRCIDGTCGFVTYGTKQESFKDFKNIWLRAYGKRLPTLEDAVRYTGGGTGERWLGVVEYIYHNS